MDVVVPKGEGKGVPTSFRVPEKLLARIDACADETGNDRTDTILHLIRWALSKYEEERATAKTKKSA